MAAIIFTCYSTWLPKYLVLLRINQQLVWYIHRLGLIFGLYGSQPSTVSSSCHSHRYLVTSKHSPVLTMKWYSNLGEADSLIHTRYYIQRHRLSVMNPSSPDHQHWSVTSGEQTSNSTEPLEWVTFVPLLHHLTWCSPMEKRSGHWRFHPQMNLVL